MKFLLIALSLVTAAACANDPGASGGGSGSGSGSGSGIRGTVLAGPACGGPVILASPCPDEPVAADIAVTKAGSPEIVATVRSGADGKFSLELAPGTYTLTPSAVGGSKLPVGGPADVAVRPGRYSEVTLNMDTGIR